MILTAKYGIFATESNLDGSDMVVAVSSDTIGGTTNVTVAEGDIVGVIELNESGIFVTLWEVHDGSPWTHGTELSAGDILLAIGTEVPYQSGSASVVLENGGIAALNIGIMDSIFNS